MHVVGTCGQPVAGHESVASDSRHGREAVDRPGQQELKCRGAVLQTSTASGHQRDQGGRCRSGVLLPERRRVSVDNTCQ